MAYIIGPGYLGDFTEGDVVDFKFNTMSAANAPGTFGTSPAVSVYKSNGTTESTADITLTADFDGITGLNHVRISMADSFYSTEKDFQVVITAGAVGAETLVGQVVAHFSVANRGGMWEIPAPDHFREATMGSVMFPVGYGTASGGSSNTIDISGFGPSADDFYNGCVIKITSGNCALQSRIITDYVGSTNIITVDRAWDSETPDSTSVFVILPVSGSSYGSLLTTQLTESYAADGVAPTLAQALFLIQQMLTEMSISSTTLTVKKLDGSTTAATFTLNDATTPSSITRTG